MIDLPPERPGHSAPPELAARRAAMEGAQRWPAQSAAEPIMLRSIPALRVRCDSQPKARVLHFHGGGFRSGTPEMDVPFAALLAQHCGIEVILPRYRLAPENPFPAGLNDARNALSALTDDLPLIVMGASAGGGIAAGLAVLEAPRLAGLVLLSAWLDLRLIAASLDANAATDPLFSRAAAQEARELYLQGSDPAHPLASPLLADLTRFPPTLVNHGLGEVLADDSLSFHQRLSDAGVAAQLQSVPGMDHVAVTRSRDAPGSAATLAALTAFITGLLQQ